MKCPACGSCEHQILKSKGKLTKELLLKCEECGNVYRETMESPRPMEVRIIISKFDESLKNGPVLNLMKFWKWVMYWR